MTSAVRPAGEQYDREGSSPPPGRLYFHTDLFAYLPLDRETGRIRLERNENGIATVRLPVLPEGQFEHPYYGTLVWDKTKFTQMRANFHDGVMGSKPFLGIDHERMNWFAARAPAAGWIVELEHDEEAGLFLTHVELTDLGEENIANRRYRYTSAEVADTYKNSRGDAHNNVLAGNTLTNSPFHDTMPGLFGQVPTRAVALSSKGPHTLWAPGDPLSTEEIRRIWPGLDFALARPSQPNEEATMARTNAETPQAATNEVAPATEETPAVTLSEPQASAAPVAAEPETGTLLAMTGVSDSVSLSREQFDQMQRQIALGVQANAMLMEQSIRQQVAGQIAAGRIPGSKEAAAFNLWMAAPEECAAYFDNDLPAVLPLTRLGFAGGGAGDPAREPARAGTEFEELVLQIRQENKGLSMMEALSLARQQNPEAHRAYASRNKKPVNGNGR